MIVDLGACFEHGANGIDIPLKVRNEDLDRTARYGIVHLFDRLGEGPGPKIREVVAVDAGDHQMLQVHDLGGFRHTARLCRVVLGRAAMRHGAVGAVSGADIAQNHEGRGAMLPALANVGAVGLFADRIQLEFAHELLDPEVVTAARGFDLQPTRLALRERLGAVPAHDLV